MSGIKSGFLTGANARIKITGKYTGTEAGADVLLAFATDLTYSIDVATMPITSMNRYAPVTNEPMAYSVSGGFTITRYTQNVTVDSDTDGNGIKDLGNASNHLDPASIMASSTFDVTIYQGTGTGATDEVAVFQIKDCRMTGRSATLNRRSVLTDRYTFVGILAGDMEGDTPVIAVDRTVVGT